MEEKRPEVFNDEEFLEQFLAFMHDMINIYESSNDWNIVNTSSEFEDLEGDLYMSWHKHGYKTFFEILLVSIRAWPHHHSAV